MKKINLGFYYNEEKSIWFGYVLLLNLILGLKYIWNNKKSLYILMFGDNLLTFVGGVFTILTAIIYMSDRFGWGLF